MRLRALGVGSVAILGIGYLVACSSENKGTKLTGSGGVLNVGGTSGSGATSAAGGVGLTTGGGVTGFGGFAQGGVGAAPGGAGGGTGTAGTGGGTSLSACPSFSGLSAMCGSTTTAAQTKQPNILLVIDKSHSMTDTPAGFTSDKWTAMKTALTAAIDAVKGQISLGLELYPFQASASTPIPIPCSDALCCQLPADGAAIEVPIELGTSSVPKIINALNATSPSGGTPTAAALQRAYEYYTVGAGAALQGEKYVLLATDGAPNCNSSLTCTGTTCVPNIDMTCTVANCCTGPNGSINCLDDMAAVQQITNLKAVNVPTFVVGIPGTQNFKTVLNNMAVAGGVPATGATSFYDVPPSGGVQGLTDTFKAITTSLVRSCDIQLQDAPMAANLVNVAIDCTVVPQGSDATSGWVLTGTTITLRGTTCDYVQTTGVMRIDVIVGCGTVG